MFQLFRFYPETPDNKLPVPVLDYFAYWDLIEMPSRFNMP